MNQKEYKEKHEELVKLAHSIEVWKQASKTKKQVQEVDTLFEQLEAITFDLECKLLLTKIEIFKKVLEILKK